MRLADHGVDGLGHQVLQTGQGLNSVLDTLAVAEEAPGDDERAVGDALSRSGEVQGGTMRDDLHHARVE